MCGCLECLLPIAAGFLLEWAQFQQTQPDVIPRKESQGKNMGSILNAQFMSNYVAINYRLSKINSRFGMLTTNDNSSSRYIVHGKRKNSYNWIHTCTLLLSLKSVRHDR